MDEKLEETVSAGTPDSDEQVRLVERMRAGDESAYEAAVRLHGPQMLAAARRLLARESDAQDAVQDAFLAAFQKIDSFEGKSLFSTWLHRITVNAALMKLRSRQRRRERSIDELLPSFSTEGHLKDTATTWTVDHRRAIENEEVRQLVRDSIEELPDTYRSVLLLRDIEQLSTDETAEVLEISPGAVKTRLHRARQALKTLLDAHIMELQA